MASVRHAIAAVALASFLAHGAAAQSRYEKPPKAILDVLDAPVPPVMSLNPSHDAVLLMRPMRYPPISDLAQPMVRLAGARIDTNTNGAHGAVYFVSFAIQRVAGGKAMAVALPPAARAGYPRWSADGKRFAFTNTTKSGIELWICEIATGKVRRLVDGRINTALDVGGAVGWMPDQKTLWAKVVQRKRGAPPVPPPVPPGPRVQESNGAVAASNTYEARDVLRDEHDSALFDYYASAELHWIDAATGRATVAGPRAIYGRVAPAPDGQHILVERVHRPYSYLHAWNRFPTDVEIWDRAGKRLFTVANLPLADQVPKDGVRTGPRDCRWRPSEPATLLYTEALDGGDPKRVVPFRDRLMIEKAPFNEPANELFKVAERLSGLAFGEDGKLALVWEYDLDRHIIRAHAIHPDDPHAPPALLWQRSRDDRYHDPGNPVFRVLANGFAVAQQAGSAIYLAGDGASPDGERPFLDRFDTAGGKSARLFRCDRQSYESFVDWIDIEAGQFVTRRETNSLPPNLYLRTLGEVEPAAAGEATRQSTARAITEIPDPTPQLRAITKQIVKYKRADGVDLSFTLYLPPSYQPGTRLPTVVWAYPLDYADPAVAGQVEGSTQRFTMIAGPSQLFFLLDGYAVIDNPTLPVVGDPRTAYDHFVDQSVAGARAAVDKAVAMGVTDPDRIGVMGHSHGALMTAILLAHSDLFRAGIARSGAFNKTLTPFGFQNERRSLWEAPEVYLQASPYMLANKIDEPLLIIHGDADVNPGTIPMQSERLYEAIRGNKGIARLVMLPHESHGYQARESVFHTVYEMIAWFDKYVKSAPPRQH